VHLGPRFADAGVKVREGLRVPARARLLTANAWTPPTVVNSTVLSWSGIGRTSWRSICDPRTHLINPAAFGRRCIPPDGVAPPSNTAGILGRRALSGGRLAVLGATPGFMRWVLVRPCQIW
jgi:hypothetical protein